MGNKDTRQTFFKRKGEKSDSSRTPITGEPNTNMDKYGKNDGRLIQRRKFGNDGAARTDLDVGGMHKPYDHGHDYGEKGRTDDRPLTKQEQQELDKAKRKRRFW